ncbi:Alpha/Beta hydrolase protein [Schizothecium vesticola]|uniref:Protein phosphatase methylesterase 1 n=1 Tax=Schizothecium vesticola TaxID=314040 RepID=A0AA40EV59_9PEZI|nr:Alpha/Beta hydrolase protein [Schizothecium vesticola]
MSDLQRRWAKAKLSAAALPHFNEHDEDDDQPPPTDRAPSQSPTTTTITNPWAVDGVYPPGDPPLLPPFDDDSSSASSSSVSSTGTIIPSPSQSLFARPLTFPTRTLSPIPWPTYFERDLYLPLPTHPLQVHHVYLTSPAPASPLFITHHGGGSCGLSFAVLASEIRKRLPGAGILSPDARGHGLTPGGADLDLSLDTLSADLHAVVLAVQEAMGWKELPPVVLVGHSLGGAVVTDLAFKGGLGAKVLGYAVLDVVEGSAMDGLAGMRAVLATRPRGFGSVREGVEWHVKSRTVRGVRSARVSVPGLLVEAPPVEEGEGGGMGREGGGEGGKMAWRWRTDLAATQPFWEGWFTGLSRKFLAAKGGKMLLLAGTDRLDTELTIGQMQGKYALQVFPEAGHFIHEDLPEKTATVLVDFYRRNDRSAMVLPPKVSDMLAQGKKV